jgi:hypothetical protein
MDASLVEFQEHVADIFFNVIASVITKVFLKSRRFTNIPTGTLMTSEGEYAENVQNNGEKGPFDSH